MKELALACPPPPNSWEEMAKAHLALSTAFKGRKQHSFSRIYKQTNNLWDGCCVFIFHTPKAYFQQPVIFQPWDSVYNSSDAPKRM
jgi:hypothetical protein